MAQTSKEYPVKPVLCLLTTFVQQHQSPKGVIVANAKFLNEFLFCKICEIEIYMKIENNGINQLAIKWAGYASIIAGGATSNVLSFLSKTPMETAFSGTFGAMISILFLNVISDFETQNLSSHEKNKISAVVTYALENIIQRLSNGDSPRNDGFFDKSESSRSQAEEIYEGVLLKCKNEHEEKKLKYIAYYLANVGFFNDITIGEANCMLKLAEEMSYRQFCIIAAVHYKMDNTVALRINDYEEDEDTVDPEILSLLQESYSLCLKRIIFCNDGKALLSSSQIEPNNLTLSVYANRFWQLFNLGEIPEADRNSIFKLFG